MTTPFRRFTSGSAGELSFDILNDVFSRIEALEGDGTIGSSRTVGEEPLLLARLGVPGAFNQYAFQEVALAPGNQSFPTMQGGINSGLLPNDIYTRAAIPLDDAVYEVGDIVLLTPFRKTDGTDYYAILRPVGSRVRPYMVMSSRPAIGSPSGSLRWVYTVARATANLNTQSDELLWSTADAQSNAVNAAEAADDGQGFIGQGTRLPSGATAVRQPIRNGTIVLCTDTGGNALVFSMPNGYEVNCGS